VQEIRLILLNPSPFLSGRRPAPAARVFFLSLPPTLRKNRRFIACPLELGLGSMHLRFVKAWAVGVDRWVPTTDDRTRSLRSEPTVRFKSFLLLILYFSGSARAARLLVVCVCNVGACRCVCGCRRRAAIRQSELAPAPAIAELTPHKLEDSSTATTGQGTSSAPKGNGAR